MGRASTPRSQAQVKPSKQRGESPPINLSTRVDGTAHRRHTKKSVSAETARSVSA
ncbi:MAG TPA: hypothetical protein VKV31_01920 [bacterium]|nr:hypothetical protein [bacterium]